MDPEEEATCGKGIAAGAALPDKMAAAFRAMADMFESHERSLDPKEPAGQAEIEAYRRLAAEHRDIGGRLAALAGLMRGYYDLPMANHDMNALMGQRSVEAFVAFVAREKELAAEMQARVAEHDAMLREMQP